VRKILDAPGEDTISGLRDRAILNCLKSMAPRPLNPPHDALGVRRRPAGRALIFVGGPGLRCDPRSAERAPSTLAPQQRPHSGAESRVGVAAPRGGERG